LPIETEVKAVQEALRDNGQDPGPIDGIMGPRTKAALKDFQRAQGLPETGQLVINTGTTIVTFLMVFLIQNTQNRDSTAMQVKLDELIRVLQGAHNALLDLEELSQEDLDRIRTSYEELAERARGDLRRGRRDTGTPPARLPERSKIEGQRVKSRFHLERDDFSCTGPLTSSGIGDGGVCLRPSIPQQRRNP
jgi:peptidoglycan hydrolase-like protein with peptidoglycan-binding domain